MMNPVVQARPEMGAVELKAVAQKYMMWSLAIASLIHFVVVGSYWASQYLTTEETLAKTIKIMKYTDLGPPPSIAGSSAAVAPSISAAAPLAKPSIGLPVPVPDAEVNPEQSFASQTDLSAVTGPVGDALGGDNAQIEQDVIVDNIDEEAPPPDFVPFEKEPQVIKRIEPDYPEVARKAGLEGTVWVKLWVDKEGKVKDVVILKSAAEVFNQPAIDAAKQWLFTPALMKTGPVSVWMSMSFKFYLTAAN